MWCPKCKNEYIEGVTTCVDCGCELVAELPEEIDENEPVVIGSLTEESTAEKLVDYLNRAGLLSCGIRPQEENEEGDIPAYDILVAQKELIYINQLFDGFLIGHRAFFLFSFGLIAPPCRIMCKVSLVHSRRQDAAQRVV